MTVQLRIDNPMLLDYIGYLFPVEGDTLKVNSEHGLGKLIIAHCRQSPKPVEPVLGEYVVTLRLPLCSASQNLEYKFLYFSRADMTQLNQALRAYFDLDFTGYYRRGESAGFSKKEIIEGFIQSRRLVSRDNYDALHKRAYRKQRERDALLAKRLMRKAYYVDESLDTSGLKK